MSLLARVRFLVLAACVAAASGLLGSRAASAASFNTPLRIPPVLTGDDISIPIVEAPVQILAGKPTTMWTFGGTFPGPTIRRPSGRSTNVTFTNELPAAAGATTIHFHGEHATTENDGQPDDMHQGPGTCDGLLIYRGCSHTYSFDFTENGAPERPAFEWYHDHRMDVTGRNVWMGLAGMVILEPPDGDATEATLPKGGRDVPLMLADRSFDADNQLDYAFNIEGNVGDYSLVNGVDHPYFEVDDVRYRLRILNASNTRPYDVALGNGASMIQIGTESGLLPRPVSVKHIRLGPAERAEVVVDFAGLLGQKLVLRDALGFGPQAELMEFRVTRDATDSSNIPETLRPLPETVQGTPLVTRTWLLTQTPDLENPDPNSFVWTINGREFDPMRADAEPTLGTSERWIFVNVTGVEHVVHIHDVDWRLVYRSGGLPPDPDAGVDVDQLKETFRVRPFEVFIVQSTFTDHTGMFVFHCHILEHEDRSMMAQFDVKPN